MDKFIITLLSTGEEEHPMVLVEFVSRDLGLDEITSSYTVRISLLARSSFKTNRCNI